MEQRIFRGLRLADGGMRLISAVIFSVQLSNLTLLTCVSRALVLAYISRATILGLGTLRTFAAVLESGTGHAATCNSREKRVPWNKAH